MGDKGIHIFGIPLFGVILPYIGYRRVPLNRDGSVVDTGHGDILDERGFYFVRPFVIEWLGCGWPLSRRGYVYRTDTGELVDEPEFEAMS